MFVGRKHELSLIRRHLNEWGKAQLIIIYGRRRVGKSTLIAKATEDFTNVLFFEGIEGAKQKDQIDQFLQDLSLQTGRVRLAAKNWREVFQGLTELIQQGRWILVFDEFPWMGAGRTQIVSELKLYWDRWIKINPDVRLFLCGSVASFMIKHVVHSKAFHNRKTVELCLGPLSPKESGKFISKRSVYEQAQMYMCLGGVPKYLEQLNPRHSLEKNINRLCFSANGFFLEEFETLFKEQFRSIKVYESVIRHLAFTDSHLSELSRKIGTAKGGGFREQINNLIRAQFIREYTPLSLGNKIPSRTRMIKLSDPFLLFYFRYMHDNLQIIQQNRHQENLFRSIAMSSINQYYGYAFERLVEDGILDVLKGLNLQLADVKEMGPYFRQKRSTLPGLQIDWLIVRRDNVWNLVEIKYTASPVGLKVISEVTQKINRLVPPERVTIEPVLISAAGVTSELKKQKFFYKILNIQDLYKGVD
jgi:AAA+ ATPase superfamily predicted ATPase